MASANFDVHEQPAAGLAAFLDEVRADEAVTYSEESAESTARSVRITGMFAAFASLAAPSPSRISTTGENADHVDLLRDEQSAAP